MGANLLRHHSAHRLLRPQQIASTMAVSYRLETHMSSTWKFADGEQQGTIAHGLRARRFALFMDLLAQVPKPTTILDIGGRERFWFQMGFEPSEDVRIVLLNLKDVETTSPFVEGSVGDATNLSDIEGGGYDIVFSNSTIEHLFTWEAQQKMAAEIRRVGKRYFIQTPNRYFPIEPHFQFPLFQFLPIALRKAMLKRFALGFRETKAKDDADAEQIAREIRLMSKRELRRLFPDAKIYDEKFLGLTKSFVAYRSAESE